VDGKNDVILRKYPTIVSSPRLALDSSQTSVHYNYLARRRTDWEVAFCGNGNKALFGQCIASAGTSLELHIELDGPVHPGLSFTVSVKKLDYYNQTVASDSASIVQVRSEAGMNSSGNDKGFGFTAAISGTTIFELQHGSVTASVAVRPFLKSAEDASEASIYVEAMDNETSLILRFVE
jgi:hypothetical protein